MRLTAIGIAAVFLMVFLVRSTLKGAAVKRSLSSVYQKIILNHIQLVVLTAAFDFNWPQMVVSYFKAA